MIDYFKMTDVVFCLFSLFLKNKKSVKTSSFLLAFLTKESNIIEKGIIDMKDSGIEWTNHTFNPWMGCTKISDACDNCYAAALTNRYKWVEWGAHGERKRTSENYWKQPYAWNRKAISELKRKKVFCCSLADVFDNHRSIQPEWRTELFEIIKNTPWLDWQLLTKRPQNIIKYMPPEGLPWNVWLGTTVENQEEAEKRIPALAAIDVKIRFLSCEPLLGEITPDLSNIDWVICGGESGPKKRKMNLAWARKLRDQCASEKKAFFMKQIDKVQDIPDDLFIRQFPKYKVDA